MDRTGFIKEDFESIEQATRVLNSNGYKDTLVVKREGLFSSTKNELLEADKLQLQETHRMTSKDGLVRVLFAINKSNEPCGTLSCACGAEHADDISKISDLIKYAKLENQ